jgi:ATP-dependent DNA ligase
MLTRAVTALPEPSACAGGCGYEPKWDGWRVLLFKDQAAGAVTLQSRTGRDLTRYFPDLARIARGALPGGVVVDGELIVWEPDRRRMSFALLQRRVSAGQRRVLDLAIQYPAHLVVFDLLQAPPDLDVRNRPLRERRQLLEHLLADAPGQITLTPQTTDPEQAREWMTAWAPLGVEGMVIKGLGEAYRPGQRGWLKLRSVWVAHVGHVVTTAFQLVNEDSAGCLICATVSRTWTSTCRSAGA